MGTAVEKVRERLRRAAEAIEAGAVPYAIAGGSAVAAWVSEVDEAAVRNTQDVEILVRRENLARIRAAFEAAGFVYRHSSGIDMFLDGPGARTRDAVHLAYAGEKVRSERPIAAPSVDEAQPTATIRVLALEAQVRMKLAAFHDQDRMDLRDLIDVGLVDASWPARLPDELAARLQQLLDTSGG